jgi:DNA processing protein
MTDNNTLHKNALMQLLQKPLPSSFPHELRFAGQPETLARPRVALVGSRHPTFYGREQAARFAKVLAENGVCVVSGAAIGIDTIANSVAFQHGYTAAVLGSGLGFPYPRSNRYLFERMAHSPNSLILSEFPDHEVAARWNFPKRNRVIAALCDFVFVIEAAVASGSMITACLAADLGVDVGALPGPVHSPTSQGSNQLIKEGAVCIERPEEILERLAILRHQRGNLTEVTRDVYPARNPTAHVLF